MIWSFVHYDYQSLAYFYCHSFFPVFFLFLYFLLVLCTPRICLPCVWVHIDFKCHSVEELGLRAETPIGTSFTDAHAGNVKFNFLNGSDPYHAYLPHRLFELRSQNQSSAQQIPSQLADSFAPESTPSAPPADNSETLMKHEPSSQFKPFRKVLEPPRD